MLGSGRAKRSRFLRLRPAKGFTGDGWDRLVLLAKGLEVWGVVVEDWEVPMENRD